MEQELLDKGGDFCFYKTKNCYSVPEKGGDNDDGKSSLRIGISLLIDNKEKPFNVQYNA